ncbi:MAG TPA: acyl-phosphate glycerol 3-phosphate acyltransferase [Flavobacteriales bacterium]|nr:acyl-phosphate glycerol 3-phosphate acyltransferase [Flavobacteriales bacterium]
MINLLNITLIIAAYLIGSIPTAVWVGKIFYNKDVREYGSGNAGATNTFRVLGVKAGIPVLIVDIFKGWLSVKLPYFFDTGMFAHTSSFINFQLVLGLAALLGHIFPIYAGFRGGKGIATLLGIIIALDFQGALFAISVFLVVLATTRYVSLSSMLAAMSFPLYIIAIEKNPYLSITIFSLFIAILVLITHQKNIERLLRGEESKIFSKKNHLDDD